MRNRVLGSIKCRAAPEEKTSWGQRMMAALQLRLQAGLSPTAPEQPKQQPASSSDQQAKQGKKSATNLAAYSDALRNSSTCKHKPKAQPEKPKEKPQARTMQCIAASKE